MAFGADVLQVASRPLRTMAQDADIEADYIL